MRDNNRLCKAGSEDLIVWVRQWTVRQEIPVERIWRIRGRVGSSSERVDEEGSVEGFEEEGEGVGRGRRRILASMGREVELTSAFRICQKNETVSSLNEIQRWGFVHSRYIASLVLSTRQHPSHLVN